VFKSQTFAPCFWIFSANNKAYLLGWNGKKAYPKHEEKEACGYLIPCYVPAIFEV
jgi:hypothetical protein